MTCALAHAGGGERKVWLIAEQEERRTEHDIHITTRPSRQTDAASRNITIRVQRDQLFTDTVWKSVKDDTVHRGERENIPPLSGRVGVAHVNNTVMLCTMQPPPTALQYTFPRRLAEMCFLTNLLEKFSRINVRIFWCVCQRY